MRIRLVEPRPPGHTVYDYAMLPRLGLPLIGTLLARAGHDVKAYCELLAPVDLGECLTADVVGISTTTSTAPCGVPSGRPAGLGWVSLSSSAALTPVSVPKRALTTRPS